MNEEEVRELLDKAIWIFAKTMPKTPHEYSLKETWRNKGKFIEVVQFIRDNGRAEYFHKRRFIYYYYNGYKYWTMGNPLDITTLINRARSENENLLRY